MHLGQQLYGDHPGKCTMKELSIHDTVGSRHEMGTELRHRWLNYDFKQLKVTHDWSKGWQAVVKEQRTLVSKIMVVLTEEPNISNDDLQIKMFPFRNELRRTRERTRKLQEICMRWDRGDFNSHYDCLLAAWDVYHPNLNINTLPRETKYHTNA